MNTKTTLYKQVLSYTLFLVLMTVNTALAYPEIQSDEDKEFVVLQLVDLRLNHQLEVNSAKKINAQTYEASISGMGGKEIGSMLYKGSSGSWILIIRTENSYHEFLKITHPVYFFTTQDGVINMDENTPDEVKNFLAPYKNLGHSIQVKTGASVTGIWYPMDVAPGAQELIKMIGLSNSRFSGGLEIRGAYNYLASSDMMMSLVADLGALPTIPGQPDSFKMQQEEVDLGIACKLTASLDFIKPKSFLRFDETDCELRIGTEVRVDVNSDHVFFDAAIGFRSIKRANSRAANAEVQAVASTLGFDPNKSTAIFVEGDIRGGIWKDIFGLKGFNMQEVKLQTLIDKETGWHIGILGQIDFGTQTRLTASVLIPVGAASGTGVALMASLDRIMLEELAMLPSVLGGPDTYSDEWKTAIKDVGLNHFGLQNVKFTFAPSVSDPDLGIDQSGTTVTGSLIAFNKNLSSLKVYANKDGIYFDDAMEPWSIGWFEMKNARFKGFIPSKESLEGSSGIKRKLNYVGQNAFVLFIDTFFEIDGNKERALASFTAANFGFEFDANVTEDIGAGFKFRLPLANILDKKAPFEVAGYFKDSGRAIANEVSHTISTDLTNDFKNIDKTYASEIQNITHAQSIFDSLKTVYENAREQAQQRYDKAVAPLEHAESVLKSKQGSLDHLHSEFKHWKSKAKHYHWYQVKEKAHAYYEEGKYWSEYEAYKPVIEAAELVVKSLEETTHFISVDADPLVVASFSEYNGARFSLAIAKGALTAAQKATSYIESLPEQILNDAFDAFSINNIHISGSADGQNDLDLVLNASGVVFGEDWNVSPSIEIASPEKAGEVAAQNLKNLTDAIAPMAGNIHSHARAKYHGTDYAQYPHGVQLAYKWERMPGLATDIAASDETTFVNNSSGYIYQWNQADSSWHQFMDGGGVIHLDAKGENELVVVNNKGRLYYRDNTNNSWVLDDHANAVYDVGYGEDGTLWVTTVKEVNNGLENPIDFTHLFSKQTDHNEFDSRYEYSIYRKKPGQNWEKMPGSLVRIDVDKDGNAWGINRDQSIYRWTGENWEQVSGRAVDIGVGGGNVWVVNEDSFVYHYISGSKKWVRITGAGANISVDGNGHLWLLNSEGHIYKNLGPR